MKKTLLLLFTFFTFYTGFSQNVTLTTQSEVDAYVGPATISGNLTIGPSTNITDLSVLSNVTSVTGYLYVYENTLLTNLNGLGNVASINQLYIGDNTELLNIDALSASLTAIGNYFSIYRNTKLTSLAGLSGVTSLNFGFYFEGCPLITDFTDLTSLSALDGTIEVVDMAGLANFNGLPAITTLFNYLHIVNCDALTDLSAFSELATIDSYLQIRGNLLLPDFNGLNKLTTVGAFVDLSLNGTITDLDGFDVLNSVDALGVLGNAELTSLNGIESLTSIGDGGNADFGKIRIDLNPKLTDISGMVNIASGITNLEINNNGLLSACEISNVCTYLGTAGVRTISNNATGCDTDVEILAACATASVSDYLLENAVSIYPNPTSDRLNVETISNINIENIALYSMQGRLIKEQNYQLQSVDMSDVSAGIYMLKIRSDQGDINARIVKQ